MKLNDFQIDQQLDSLDGWRRDGEQIYREYHFETFKIALASMMSKFPMLEKP